MFLQKTKDLLECKISRKYLDIIFIMHCLHLTCEGALSMHSMTLGTHYDESGHGNNDCYCSICTKMVFHNRIT